MGLYDRIMAAGGGSSPSFKFLTAFDSSRSSCECCSRCFGIDIWTYWSMLAARLMDFLSPLVAKYRYSYGAELLLIGVPVALWRAAAAATIDFDVVGEIERFLRGGFFGGVG